MTVTTRYACPSCKRLLRKLPQGRIFYGYRENNYYCVNKKCGKQWYLAGDGTYFVERPND